MERLRLAHYRLWYDKDDIHVGENWREAIDRGIEHSHAVIVCLTPDACASPFVKYEIQRALEHNKPVFPVKMENIDERADLVKLGLIDIQFVDFTNAGHDTWDRATARLLDDMMRFSAKLRVTRHDLRRERGHEAYQLHQKYLSYLVERIGKLSLASMSSGADGLVNLENVYTDSITPLCLNVEVTNWQITDWWISIKRKEGDEAPPRINPAKFATDTSPLDVLIDRLQESIDAYQQRYPQDKPTEESNLWHNGEHENVLTLTIQHIAALQDRLVLLGKPGGGKSTFVKHLALCLAGEQIDAWTREANLASLEGWTHGALTPIYVELRRFIRSEYFPDNGLPDASHLWSYIKAEILGEELAAYAPDLAHDLEEGRALLILDGLDEVPYAEGKLKARQSQLQRLASAIYDRYGKSRVMVASRPYAYEGWKLPGFITTEVADLNDRERLKLASQLYRVSGLEAEEAAEKAAHLNIELKGRRIDPQLRDRPLFLTQMAAVYLKNAGTLPTRRGTLYRLTIELLLDRWVNVKPDSLSLPEILGGASIDDLFSRLAALAYDVHRASADQHAIPEITEEQLYKYLKPIGRRVAADLITYLSENAGVLVCPGQNEQRDVFQFAHRTFQEYLAAVQLVTLCDEQQSFELVRMLIESVPGMWREVAIMVGDVLADASRDSDLWDLLDDLLEDNVLVAISKETPRWWSVWLAGEIANEQGFHLRERLRKGEKAVRDSLVEWQVKLIMLDGALPVQERAACGRVLARLGDPRRGVGLRSDGLPDIDWVDIPAGIFLMGSDKAQDPDTFPDEVPLQPVDLPAFRISRYPITNTQFAAFVVSLDGYTNPIWWTQAGLEWKGNRSAPDEYEELDYRLPNHPRVCVTWYEAYAFCRWLGMKFDVDARMPTEEEWEKAARGTDGRFYPYGNEFDPTKANTYDTGIRQPNAVGMFPNGASPYGVLEMSGNVWEWCLTKRRQSYLDPPDDDPEGVESRVLRGGGYASDYFLGRCAARNSYVPEIGLWKHGFRVMQRMS